MKKLMKFLVSKLWNCESFQEAVKEEIVKYPLDFLWHNFNLLESKVNGYKVLHQIDQMVPWVFTSEQEVRQQVADWDKVLQEANKTESKPKRKYHRKPKAQ